MQFQVKDSDDKEKRRQLDKSSTDTASQQPSISVKTSQPPVHTIKYVTVQQAPSTPTSSSAQKTTVSFGESKL